MEAFDTDKRVILFVLLGLTSFKKKLYLQKLKLIIPHIRK